MNNCEDPRYDPEDPFLTFDAKEFLVKHGNSISALSGMIRHDANQIHEDFKKANQLKHPNITDNEVEQIPYVGIFKYMYEYIEHQNAQILMLYEELKHLRNEVNDL